MNEEVNKCIYIYNKYINNMYRHTHTYIYIYIYVCVCVRVWTI